MNKPLFWAGRDTPPGYDRVGWLNPATPEFAEGQLKVGQSAVYALHAEHGQAVAGEKGPLALDTRHALKNMSVAHGVDVVAKLAKVLRAMVAGDAGKAVGYYCPLVLMADDDEAVHAKAVSTQDTAAGGSLFQLFDFIIIDGHPHPANSFATWCRQFDRSVAVAKARKVKGIKVVIAEHWCSGTENGQWLPDKEAKQRFEYAVKKLGAENVIRWSARRDECPIGSVIDAALGVKENSR